MSEEDKLVAPDFSEAWLGGCRYRAVPNSEPGVMEREGTRDMVLFQKHSEIEDIFIEDRKERVLECFKRNRDLTISGDADAEEDLLDVVNQSRRFRALIYPFAYFCPSSEMEEKCIYTVSELPEDFCEKYQAISSAIRNKAFAFHSRIVAAMNLAETIRMLDDSFRGCLTRMAVEAFYVNMETGEVRVILDRIMSSDGFGLSDDHEYLQIESTQGEALDSGDLLKFAAYVSFRLLCIGNPYDGKETLVKYPLLTAKAYDEIHSGRYGFVFSETNDGFSEYINREMQQRWQSIPGKIRQAFTKILDGGEGCDISVEQWLKYMRMLRDCLIYVKGQPRLCDPDASNQFLFLASEEYSVPVLPRKALYWYHAGIGIDDVGSEVIAGITSEYSIVNRSKEKWIIDGEAELVPGDTIKPSEGRDIAINGIHFKVVSGVKE